MPILGSATVGPAPAPPQLDTTAGAGSANAYITAEQFAYWVSATPGATMPLAPDGTVDTARLARAILTATRLLDEYFYWVGRPSKSGQSLAWPRRAVEDNLDINSIPTEIQLATCAEVAYLLSEDRPSWYASQTARQPISVRAGPVSVAYDSGMTQAAPVSPATIEAIPSHWYKGSAASAGASVSIATGVQV